MLSVRGFLLVMFKSAFIVAFLSSLPRPVVAFTGLKNWSRKALYTKVDLCTQSCYSQIIPGLYLSNARAASDPNVLKHLGITHVLTVEAHQLPKSVFVGTNIKNLFIRAPHDPSTNLLQYFPISNSFIFDGLHSGNVIVHCYYGISRSATVVIAYLMQAYKLSYRDAYRYVKKRRRFIDPAPFFVEQLKEYELRNYKVKAFDRLDAYINVYTRNKTSHETIAALIATVAVGIILSPVIILTLF